MIKAWLGGFHNVILFHVPVPQLGHVEFTEFSLIKIAGVAFFGLQIYCRILLCQYLLSVDRGSLSSLFSRIWFWVELGAHRRETYLSSLKVDKADRDTFELILNLLHGCSHLDKLR